MWGFFRQNRIGWSSIYPFGETAAKVDALYAGWRRQFRGKCYGATWRQGGHRIDLTWYRDPIELKTEIIVAGDHEEEEWVLSVCRRTGAVFWKDAFNGDGEQVAADLVQFVEQIDVEADGSASS